MTAVAGSGTLERLVARYDPELFMPTREGARLRLVIEDGEGSSSDVVFESDRAFLVAPSGRPDAELTASGAVWESVAEDLRGGLDAFRRGTLRVRHDLHLGVGFLAATAASGEHGLRFRSVETRVGPMSISEAGSGDPVLMIHGLGATKASFLPTLAALASSYRCIAIDLPGSATR